MRWHAQTIRETGVSRSRRPLLWLNTGPCGEKERPDMQGDEIVSDPEILASRDPEGTWQGVHRIGVVRAERRMEHTPTTETCSVL